MTESTRRGPRPFNPRDLFDLRGRAGLTDSHLLPLDDVSRVRFLAGTRANLNGAFRLQMIEAYQSLWASILKRSGGNEPKAHAAFVKHLGTEPDEWWYDVVPRFRWRGLEITDARRAAISQESQSATWNPYELDSYYGARAYQIEDALIRGSWIHHLGGFGRDGHGLYFNLHGDLTVMDSLFEEMGGQAIQLVNREDAFKNGAPQLDNRPAKIGMVAIKRCGIINAGYSPMRGSWAISLAGLGRSDRQVDVLIEDLYMRCNYQGKGGSQHNGDPINSRGGVLIENALKNGQRGYGTVTIRRADVELWEPDRGPLTINNSENVLIEDCRIISHSGRPWLEIDRLDFSGFQDVSPCGSVRIRNVSGNQILRVRDKQIGPVEGHEYLIRGGVVVEIDGVVQ